MNFEILQLGASRVDANTGLPVAQGTSPVSNDGSDNDPYGEIALFAPIGFASLPAPATSGGWCEGFVVRDAAGLDAVHIGGRDARAASIYGNLSPGDTAVFSTGENKASQLLLKENRKQFVGRTVDSDGKDMLVVMDGVADTITITGFKQALSMSRDGGIILGNENGSIAITADGKILLNGAQVLIGVGATPASGCAYSPAGPANLVSQTVFIAP